MDSIAVRWLPGALRVAREHRRAGQQHDNLCGPYWGSVLLRACAGLNVIPEEVAIAAGSQLPQGDPSTWLPEGATSRQDYRVAIPVVAGAAGAGTAAAGLVDAVARLSTGGWTLVPLRAQWSAERVEAVIELCREHPEWEAVPVCNLRTGMMWGTHLSLLGAAAWLAGQDMEVPPAEWDVGHFVSIAGTIRGAERTLVLVRDSYPTLGWDGHHLQPHDRLAAALARGDGHEGGVLLFTSAEHADEATHGAEQDGFEAAVWDNGTPWPPVLPEESSRGGFER